MSLSEISTWSRMTSSVTPKGVLTTFTPHHFNTKRCLNHITDHFNPKRFLITSPTITDTAFAKHRTILCNRAHKTSCSLIILRSHKKKNHQSSSQLVRKYEAHSSNGSLSRLSNHSALKIEAFAT